jgi:hypothetical protein
VFAGLTRQILTELSSAIKTVRGMTAMPQRNALSFPTVFDDLVHVRHASRRLPCADDVRRDSSRRAMTCRLTIQSSQR